MNEVSEIRIVSVWEAPLVDAMVPTPLTWPWFDPRIELAVNPLAKLKSGAANPTLADVTVIEDPEEADSTVAVPPSSEMEM